MVETPTKTLITLIPTREVEPRKSKLSENKPRESRLTESRPGENRPTENRLGERRLSSPTGPREGADAKEGAAGTMGAQHRPSLLGALAEGAGVGADVDEAGVKFTTGGQL